jgi:pimeloyl-ACP methyl ester carboxylesterase
VAKTDDWLTDEVVRMYAAPLAVRGTMMAQVWQARSPKDGKCPVPRHLAQIAQPTLVLWGRDDPVFPASDGARLAKTLPHARLHVVARGGHLPHEVEPQEVNRLILEALQ